MSSVNIDISSIRYEEKLNGKLNANELYDKLREKLILIESTSKKGNKSSEKKKVEIIVCGPEGVGKSTLIKTLFGKVADTSSNLNINTNVGTSYKFVNDNVIIWDTKGFNKWNRTSIDDFWKDCFQYTKSLPSFCLFCVGTGAHADTSLIKYMFDEYIFKSNIPLCWVITKAGITDTNQTRAFVIEGVKLVGNAIEVIQPTIAWKTTKGFILRINSINSCINIPNQPEIRIKKFGIKTLKKIFAENIPMSSQQYLMELFKDDKSYLSNLTSVLSANKSKVFSKPLQINLEDEVKCDANNQIENRYVNKTTDNTICDQTSDNCNNYSSESFQNGCNKTLKTENVIAENLEKSASDTIKNQCICCVIY